MKTVIIYLSYDGDEEFLHVAIDNEFTIDFIPKFSNEDVFKEFKRISSDDIDLDLYIIADKDASEWDFKSNFKENGIDIDNEKRFSKGTLKESQICKILENRFKDRFIFENSDNYGDDNCKVVKILFPSGEPMMDEKSKGKEISNTISDNESANKKSEDGITLLAKLLLKMKG
ncbi:MAG: hypothetical protein K6F77_08245 [Lachnospiraceae bacterium]|nr:hypothetical protein [Lachnospiraceae bacterium]